MKKFKTLDKKQYKEMLEDICDGYCSEDHDCILKQFLIEAHPSPRLLMQMKCVNKFKDILFNDKDFNYDSREPIDWNTAMIEWIDRGYAEKFGETYIEGMTFREIWKKIK